MTYLVQKVRKEKVTIKGASHEHIVGVVTPSGTYYSNQEVVDSIQASNDWYTDIQGVARAKIEVVSYCPAKDCLRTPYIRTEGDKTKKNNLENLPPG